MVEECLLFQTLSRGIHNDHLYTQCHLSIAKATKRTAKSRTVTENHRSMIAPKSVPHENLWGVSRCNCETAIPWHTRPEVWTTFPERNDLATSLTHWQLNLFTRDILLWTWIPICVPKYVSKWSRALVTRILPENCHGVILKSLLNLGDPQSLPFHCLLRNTEARIHKHDLLKFAM